MWFPLLGSLCVDSLVWFPFFNPGKPLDSLTTGTTQALGLNTLHFYTNPTSWELREVKPLTKCHTTREGGGSRDLDEAVTPMLLSFSSSPLPSVLASLGCRGG